MTDGPIRVALLKDHDLVREGLRGVLRPFSDTIRFLGVVRRDGPREPVDVSLLALDEDLLGPEELSDLVADPANGAVVVLGYARDPRTVALCLELGAAGFISKAATAAEIVRGVVAAASGARALITADRRPGGPTRDHRPHTAVALAEAPGYPVNVGPSTDLTYRETELLALLPSGMTNRELADLLFVSQNTIKTQLRSLFTKLGVKNRTQAASLVTDGEATSPSPVRSGH